MAKNKHYTVKYRRKRKGLTNYKKRLELLKSRKARLVVRRSNMNVVVQIVQYQPDGDKVLFSFKSSGLKKMGWKGATGNIPAAYLSGLVLGTIAKDKVKEAILDLGLQKPVPGSRLYAVLKGVVDGGVNVPCDKAVFPSEERLAGLHVQTLIQGARDKVAFSLYKKNAVSDVKTMFEQVKKNILGK